MNVTYSCKLLGSRKLCSAERVSRNAISDGWIPNFAVALNRFCDIFFTLIPESYHCKPDPSLLPSTFIRSNFSQQEYLNFTIPWVKGSGLSHCELYKYPANFTNFTEKVPIEVVHCTKGWEYSQEVGLQSNYVTEWDLVCENYWKIPLQHICFMMGWILGYVVLGTICDCPTVFLLMRLSQGSMLAGVLLSSYIARLELCDPPHRLMVTMIGGFFAVCAELLLPGVAVLCRDWPVLQAVATLPLLFLLSYWCCSSLFPESLRWLLATGQIPLARRSVQSFSTKNGVYLNEEIYPAETILSGIQYCFTRNLHAYSKQFYFGYFIRVLMGALACILLCLSVNRMGRRGVLLLAAIITGLSSLLLLALTQYLRGGLVLVLSLLGLLSSQALAMLSVFFASEVMPTVVRGGSLGLILAAGCVGKAASSLMELQNNGGYFLHHVVFASFAVLSVLCIMLLPESKRKPLPDSLKDGESQRRPPLFLSRTDRDNLPLLHTHPQPSEYNPDNYSRLVAATKRMLAKETLPYKMGLPPHPPLLQSNGCGPHRGLESHKLHDEESS
ncbi:hypothetical protein JZ751_020885 [Albula glossodonta]|uniref:Solute carrier family 22 member 31 n=1 Tax=Albula glossodonta TaxID=121402 RepID=A0A8T2PLT5_9TELE|nr:hypothetical protein JZ751_020885 [Albula glossodonta]